MTRWIKLVLMLALLSLVLVLLFGLYVGVVSGAASIPGLSKVFRASVVEPSPEEVARSRAAQEKIEASIQDNPSFHVELTERELTALLASRMDPDSPIRDLKAQVTPQGVTFTGKLNGVVGVPTSGTVVVKVDRGEVRLELEHASVGVFGVPSDTEREIEATINRAVDLDSLFREHGATLVQQVRLEDGKAVVIGVQQTGADVSANVRSRLADLAAQLPGNAVPEPPGSDVVPPGSVASKEGDEIYLALGDSLAANVGISDPRDGYVSRFHGYLERQTGRSLGLVNLGVSGESSISFSRRQLPQALREIEVRRDDDIAATRVSVVTLDLGANDLLSHLTSEDCLQAPAGRVCQDRLDAALVSFRANFGEIVPVLQGAMDPDTEFYIMTVYNPLGLGTNLTLEARSNVTVDRLNAVIHEVAQRHGVTVADVRPVMGRNARHWTNILAGDIHPNSKGYQALAFSLAQAREE